MAYIQKPLFRFLNSVLATNSRGFRPSDVRQGGVGDCWFMSALAVVAERHDLMRKLLPNLNEGAESGCHEVRLFLDGHLDFLAWNNVLYPYRAPNVPPPQVRYVRPRWHPALAH